MQEGVISTENAVIAEKVKDGDKVRPFDTVKVYATKKAGFIKEGEEWPVHPLLARKLIDSGKATEKKPGKAKDSKELVAEDQP